ncbi:hypothetical protein [Denitrobaculum tricleocarpae]|uniref:Uncharacterized protein n=1 Tax=Denitrobaculum tricleocarpae TaxID=2591009 RepID=A0A545T5P1_9PROT|nr:hypothetical protein [Denitrobaculum tricleocarpae]TQV72495.1 hypothetical protein FKG95_25840 [Denitrobaculum tricleocarpae]
MNRPALVAGRTAFGRGRVTDYGFRSLINQSAWSLSLYPIVRGGDNRSGFQQSGVTMQLNCQRLAHLLLCVAIMIPLTGCAPAFFKYRYVSLNLIEGLEIIEVGRLTDDRLFFHNAMPLAYLLKRDSYDLRFEIDKTRLTGEMRVTIVSRRSENRSLQGDDAASEPGGVAFDHYRELPENTLRFASSNEFMFGGREEFTAVFKVVDDTLGLITKESIEFKLETNGFYVVIDAI